LGRCQSIQRCRRQIQNPLLAAAGDSQACPERLIAGTATRGGAQPAHDIRHAKHALSIDAGNHVAGPQPQAG